MRRASIWLRLVALVGVLGLVAAACGDDDDGGAAPGPTTTVAGDTTTAPPDDGPDDDEPQFGGTLTYLYASETRSMDPAIGGGSALSGEPPRLLAVFDALMYADNATNEIVMGTAESIETDDNRVWTMRIRPGITFTDGTAYDAEAVRVEWERRMNPELGSPSLLLLASFEEMEVVDPLTLRITLRTENGQFPRNLAANLAYIPSPTAVAESGEDFSSRPVGAGPFVLAEWTRDSRMVLERNPDYWNAPLPYLDRVVIRVLLDEEQRMSSLVNREADATPLNLLPVQARAERAGLGLAPPSAIGSNGIAYNMDRAPFDDVRIRRAVQMAIDPEQLNQIATEGLGEVPRSWFPADHVFSDPSVVLPAYDPDEAQRLFLEYAEETGADVALDFDNLSDTGVNPRIGEFITGVLSSYDRVGATFTSNPQAQLTENIRGRNFRATGYAYLGADPEPNFTESWLSTGFRNFWGIADADLDAALLAARATLDTDERREAYLEAQEILNEILPMYIFPRTVTAFAYRPDRVRGIEHIHDDGGTIFHLVWVTQ